jgi:DNA sulfur modification protein DndD
VAEAEARRNGLVLDMLEERDEKLLGALAKAGVTGMPVRNVAAWLKSDRDKTAARASRVEQYLGLSPEATDAIVRLERTGISAEVRGLRDELKATAESRESFDAAERKLAMIPDQQALGLLVAERERLRQAAIARETELGIVDETVKSLEGRVALQEKRVDGLVDVAVDEKFRGADSERSIAAIDRVGPALAEFRKLVTQRNVVRLEELITESLNQLLHKRSLLSRISIAPDTLRLRLYDRAGREVGPQRISAGERQLLAVSMVWGLARASNRPLPTIIDTPLGRLDSRHRIHLVERYFPVASHQVVLLSTDEEVNEKYYGKLKPALGRSYRLEFEEGTQSTSVTQGYFW